MGTDNVEQALSLGVEKQVQAYAANNRKATAYLETLNEQLDILEGFQRGTNRLSATKRV